MFRLLRLVLYLGAFGAFLWFGATVRIGDRTLFEHLWAIGQTHESKDLMRGTKAKVGNLVDRAADRVVKGVSKNSPTQGNVRGERGADEPGSAPLEEVQDQDRSALRGIIGRGAEKP